MPAVETAAVSSLAFAALLAGHRLGDHAIRRNADAHFRPHRTTDDSPSGCIRGPGPAYLRYVASVRAEAEYEPTCDVVSANRVNLIQHPYAAAVTDVGFGLSR